MRTIQTYREFVSARGALPKARALLRAGVIRARAANRNIGNTSGWVSFPYYHHVFDDEKLGFERQLEHFRNFGDFISFDQSRDLIAAGEPIDGRYFCLSFDDGFRNCYTNMLEITDALDVPVLIFLPTDYIGLEIDTPEHRKPLERFFPEEPKHVPFLNWDQCREMLASGVTFGSHTCSHAHLKRLSDEEVTRELSRSKATIERELRIECVHFAPPWGHRGVDFGESVPRIATEVGYETMVTSDRGKMRTGDDLMGIPRHRLLANWGTFQLDYFFGL